MCWWSNIRQPAPPAMQARQKPTTMGHTIRSLEERLGVRPFNRTMRSMV
jgi:DNA-binding transcriptional LysR family regulator